MKDGAQPSTSARCGGPLCAHLLGLAGARIVKVETPTRPDGARYGDPGFYQLLYDDHRSVVLDPATAEGRGAMAALVEAADIVIEAVPPARPRPVRAGRRRGRRRRDDLGLDHRERPCVRARRFR